MLDFKVKKQQNSFCGVIVTAGSAYLDIDAYACMIAMAELLNLRGIDAVAYSPADYNYSVTEALAREGEILKKLPGEYLDKQHEYIIVDVSDPDFIRDFVPEDRVVAIYDHHVGFEEYWSNRIGSGTHIEFIGAAATLVLREWQKEGLLKEMKRSTARLLVAAILDNTLNLTSSNTTDEDRDAFHTLSEKANVDKKWCESYFEDVGKSIDRDLRNAIFGDIKTVKNNPVLPKRFSQLCIWDAQCVLSRLSEIRDWFSDEPWDFIINIIDIKRQCSYFVCDNCECQKKIEEIFGVRFELGVTQTVVPYLRKQILKKILIRSDRSKP